MSDRVTGSPSAPATAEPGFAASLRGFGPLGIAAILIILAGNLLVVPLSAIFVLIWAKLSKTPWREIGYVRPKSWAGGLVVGIGFGVAFKFLMKAVVMPLLGAPPVNAAFHHLAGNPEMAIFFAVYALVIGAGFGEETVYRGWMFERFGKLFGHGAGAKALIVLVTSALFAAAHYTGQGLPGVEQAAITGLVFGSVFAITGRIWMLMCAHAAFDLAALWMIYFNLESRIAHLVFP